MIRSYIRDVSVTLLFFIAGAFYQTTLNHSIEATVRKEIHETQMMKESYVHLADIPLRELVEIPVGNGRWN